MYTDVALRALRDAHNFYRALRVAPRYGRTLEQLDALHLMIDAFSRDFLTVGRPTVGFACVLYDEMVHDYNALL